MESSVPGHPHLRFGHREAQVQRATFEPGGDLVEGPRQSCLICEGSPCLTHWASCRNPVGCLGKWLGGQRNYGALGIGTRQAHINGDWGEGKLPTRPELLLLCAAGRELSCSSQDRLSSVLSCHTDNSPLAGLIGCWQ